MAATIQIGEMYVNYLLIACGMFIIFIIKYVCRVIFLENYFNQLEKFSQGGRLRIILKLYVIHSFQKKQQQPILKKIMTACQFGNTLVEEKSCSSHMQGILSPKRPASTEHLFREHLMLLNCIWHYHRHHQSDPGNTIRGYSSR